MASRPRTLEHGGFAKSVIVGGEDPDELKKLQHEYVEHFAPRAGPETTLVDELVRTAWRIARLDRAQAALDRIAMQRYIDEGPPPPSRPMPPADDVLGRILATAPPTPDPRSLHLRIKTLEQRIAVIRDDVDADSDLVRDVATISRKYGSKRAADHLIRLKKTVTDFDQHIAGPGAHHAVLEELADSYKDADAFLAEFKRTVKARVRPQKRRLQELEEEVAPLWADVGAIFSSGAGVELDPRAKTPDRLWDERRRLLRDFDRALHSLVQARELGVSVHVAGTGPNLRIVK